MSLLAADLLLVLSLLFVRPVADHAWAPRLLLHALVLAGCLLLFALPGGRPPLLCLAGSVVALLQAALCGWFGRSGGPFAARGGPARGRPGVAWLVAGLLALALAARLVPEPALLMASTGILLSGLCGVIAAGSATGRASSLLLAANGLLLAACALPGAGWQFLFGILLLQGGLVWMLLRPAAPVAAVGDVEP